MNKCFFDFLPAITEAGKYYASIKAAKVVCNGEKLLVTMAMKDTKGKMYDDLVVFFKICASQKSVEMDFVKAVGNFVEPQELLGRTLGVEIELYEKDDMVHANPKTFFTYKKMKTYKNLPKKFKKLKDLVEDEEETTVEAEEDLFEAEDEVDENTNSEDEDFADFSDEEE